MTAPAHDFLVYHHARGWTAMRPLTDAARDWAARFIGEEAAAWAADTLWHDAAPGEFWVHPRDAVDIAAAFVADGLTCPGMAFVRETTAG